VSYEFDVFLSYRRAGKWPRFVQQQFVPMLDHWLSTELGEEARIFFDVNDIDTGQSWPERLADGVANSRLMLCLWSKEYFRSKWCTAEMAHMLARREAAAIEGRRPPLIIAAVLHDGEAFPAEIGDIQRFPIQPYANPWMREDSPKAEALSEEIRSLAASIHKASGLAPDFNPDWRALATERFQHLFLEGKPPQIRPPSLGVAL
jgi:TIR domain-containing protein